MNYIFWLPLLCRPFLNQRLKRHREKHTLGLFQTNKHQHCQRKTTHEVNPILWIGSKLWLCSFVFPGEGAELHTRKAVNHFSCTCRCGIKSRWPDPLYTREKQINCWELEQRQTFLHINSSWYMGGRYENTSSSHPDHKILQKTT